VGRVWWHDEGAGAAAGPGVTLRTLPETLLGVLVFSG
jgi:hypothetical protein